MKNILSQPIDPMQWIGQWGALSSRLSALKAPVVFVASKAELTRRAFQVGILYGVWALCAWGWLTLGDLQRDWRKEIKRYASDTATSKLAERQQTQIEALRNELESTGFMKEKDRIALTDELRLLMNDPAYHALRYNIGKDSEREVEGGGKILRSDVRLNLAVRDPDDLHNLQMKLSEFGVSSLRSAQIRVDEVERAKLDKGEPAGYPLIAELQFAWLNGQRPPPGAGGGGQGMLGIPGMPGMPGMPRMPGKLP